MNITIIEKVCYMLSNSKLSKSLQAEAASSHYFLINRSPSFSIDKQTPIEAWSGNPTTYFDLNIFGCQTYARVDNGKLEPRSTKYVFLCYKGGGKGYKLWCPETHKTIISRDVEFDEFIMLSNLSTNDPCDTSDQKSGMQVDL